MSASIVFQDQTKPATINYSVPLPGSHLGQRIVRLDLGLVKADWRTAAFQGESHTEAAGITRTGSGYSVDSAKSERYLRKKLRRIGYQSGHIDAALRKLPSLLSGGASRLVRSPSEPPSEDGGWSGPASPDTDTQLDSIVANFAANANRGVAFIPVPDSTGGSDFETADSDEDMTPDPQLFLIEKYAISSFLGDYGMGRTVRTFTLLPGESTTIRLKTWQSTKQSIKESSSIIDSHHNEAKTRFQDQVQNETTDKQTQSQEKKWSVSAEASAKWGWGSAKIKGSASGTYQSGREQFAKQVSSAVNEHARSSSAKRELSVTSASEVSEEQGYESVIERTISNVNMRRVLNFVFRELNQEYITKLHLTEIRLGYTNGMNDSWREVPISGLRQLLEDVLADSRVEQIASEILKLAAIVLDQDDQPVKVLEQIEYNPDDGSSNKSDIVFDSGVGLPQAPTNNIFYRFKKGPIGQDSPVNENDPEVDGVLLSSQNVGMRTDSVLVEVLLGEADALDEFAMEIQQAAAEQKSLLNEREKLLQQTLLAIQDPIQRAELATKLFVAADDSQS